MKILTTGDVFSGQSYADMVNKAIGTSYSGYQQSSVSLDKFGVEDVIAWFVYMDGTEHGYEDGWRWKNYLWKNGEEIREFNVSLSKARLIDVRNDLGYRPYRLAFQIDPHKDGDKYCCKFVGAFAFASFLDEDLSAIKYKKISDNFIIGANGENVEEFNSEKTFINSMNNYKRPIEEFHFSDRAYKILKELPITYMYELLEIEKLQGWLSNVVRSKLYECFGEKL